MRQEGPSGKSRNGRRQLWSKHPRFVVVPHNSSFVKKILSGLAALESIVSELRS